MNAENALTDLYARLIDGWKAGDSDAMASAVAPDGLVVGFDGSQMMGRDEVAFQTTPARFDGSPDLAGALTGELAELIAE